MIDAEHLHSSFGTADTSLPAHALVSRWWPSIALLVGVAIIVIGGILLSP